MVAQDIVEFELRDPTGAALPAFTPGAHLRVQTPSGAERKYSLVNPPPDSGRYLIAVKREAEGRGGSLSMHAHMCEGDTIEVDAPDNAFPLAANAKRFIFIAGGIGITPILCMARTLHRNEQTQEHEPLPFKLYYLTRDAASAAYRDEVIAPGPRAVVHHDEGDAARAFDLWPLLEKPVAGTHVYCCGPRGLIERRRQAGDKRNQHIFVTAAGKKLKAALVPHALAVNRLAIRGMRAADVAVARRVLLGIIENVAAAESPATPSSASTTRNGKSA